MTRPSKGPGKYGVLASRQTPLKIWTTRKERGPGKTHAEDTPPRPNAPKP